MLKLIEDNYTIDRTTPIAYKNYPLWQVLYKENTNKPFDVNKWIEDVDTIYKLENNRYNTCYDFLGVFHHYYSDDIKVGRCDTFKHTYLQLLCKGTIQYCMATKEPRYIKQCVALGEIPYYESLTFYIRNSFESSFSTLYTKYIKKQIKEIIELGIEIIYVDSIEKELYRPMEFPNFKSLEERNIYLDKIAKYSNSIVAQFTSKIAV